MIVKTQPFRLPPKGPVWAYQSYVIKQPLRTHFRKATCAEAECNAFKFGWQTIVPVDSPAAQYIRTMSGRHFTEVQAVQFNEDTGTDVPLIGMACFNFPPGQQAFASDEHEHRLPIGKPPIFLVRGGDYRGNPTGYRRTHVRPEDWVDDFANHQLRLVDQKEKG